MTPSYGHSRGESLSFVFSNFETFFWFSSSKGGKFSRINFVVAVTDLSPGSIFHNGTIDFSAIGNSKRLRQSENTFNTEQMAWQLLAARAAAGTRSQLKAEAALSEISIHIFIAHSHRLREFADLEKILRKKTRCRCSGRRFFRHRIWDGFPAIANPAVRTLARRSSEIKENETMIERAKKKKLVISLRELKF